MSIKYDLFNRIEPANVYLCKPRQGKVCALNGIDRNSFSYTTALQDIDSITFTVDRYIDVDGNQVESYGYNDLDYLMEVSIDDIGTFIIDTPPTVTKDTDKEFKEVSAKSCEWEMLSKDLVAFKVNTGEDTSVERLIDNNIDFTGLTIEYVRVYDRERSQFSLLDIVIKEKLSDWSVGYVSEDIAKKTPYFNIDSTNVYAFFTQDMAKYLQCIFKFDAVNRIINVYSAEEIGEDTNINISDKNLLQQLSIEPQTEEIYTRYKIFGNDELDITQVNFGSDSIEDISYYLDTKYMPQELIDKYKAYAEYKENKRTEYIDKMKEYITTLETRDELVNRLPLDALNYDWDSFNEDELKEELGYFQGLVNVILQNLVDVGFETTNLPIVREFINNHKSSNELNKYKKELHLYVHNIDKLIDSYINSPTEETLETIINNIATIASSTDLQRMLDGNFTWFNGITYSKLQDSMYWWDYVSYTTSIIPNIDTALDNLYLTDDNKADYDESWKTNWELYGTNELKAQIELYKNKMETLVDYTKPWSSLSSTEKANYTGEQPYTDLHNDYVEAKKNYDEATAKYNELMGMVNAYNADLETIQSELSSIANDVSIKNESFGFTENELLILGSFYIDAEYTNENFLVTDYTTSIEKIDIELELLDYAKEDIAKQSRPQYHFTCDIDNLFAIADYKMWHSSLSNGNFIWISLDGEKYEKVRIISLTYNPMLPNDSELEVEFSNMLCWNGQRSDLTSLFDNAMSSTSNEISRGSLSSSSGSTEVSNELIRYILNSRPMVQSMEAINLQQEVVNQKTFKVIAESITLSGNQIVLDGDTTVMPGFTLTADNLDVNDIFAQTITAEGSITGAKLYGTYIESKSGKIADWTINTNSFKKTVINVNVERNSQDEKNSGYFTYTYAMQAPDNTNAASFLYVTRRQQESQSDNPTYAESASTETIFRVDNKGNVISKRANIGNRTVTNNVTTGSTWDIFSKNISSINYEKKGKYYHLVYMRNPSDDNSYSGVFGLVRNTSSSFSTGNESVFTVNYNGNISTIGTITTESLKGTGNRVLCADNNGKLVATGTLNGNITVDKSSATSASVSSVGVANTLRSGSFRVNTDGLLGIWDLTNNQWMLYSSTTGVLNLGTTSICKGVNIGRNTIECTVVINGNQLQIKTTTAIDGSLGVTGNIFSKNVNPIENSTSASTGYTLGTSELKWRYLYSFSSAIQTSDKNYKHTISYDMENLDGVFNALKPCTYFMVGGDRKHMGFIANEVEEAMNQNGMTIDDLSFVCKDPEYRLKDENKPDEEENREYLYDSEGNQKYIYGLKYTELHALEVWQIQKLKNRIKELEERLSSLESK